MTTTEYLEALRKLGLSPYGKGTCKALGMSPRAIARMAAGATITPTVAILLQMYLRHGLSGRRLVPADRLRAGLDDMPGGAA